MSVFLKILSGVFGCWALAILATIGIVWLMEKLSPKKTIWQRNSPSPAVKALFKPCEDLIVESAFWGRRWGRFDRWMGRHQDDKFFMVGLAIIFAGSPFALSYGVFILARRRVRTWLNTRKYLRSDCRTANNEIFERLRELTLERRGLGDRQAQRRRDIDCEEVALRLVRERNEANEQKRILDDSY